MLLMDHK